jgi:hypothetical protein
MRGDQLKLTALTTGVPDDLVIVAAPEGLDGEALQKVIAERLAGAQQARDAWDKVDHFLRSAEADPNAKTVAGIRLADGTIIDVRRIDSAALADLLHNLGVADSKTALPIRLARIPLTTTFAFELPDPRATVSSAKSPQTLAITTNGRESTLSATTNLPALIDTQAANGEVTQEPFVITGHRVSLAISAAEGTSVRLLDPIAFAETWH